MKSKIFAMLSLLIFSVCIFALSISAQGLIALDSDPGLDCDESQISYFSSIAEPKTLDSTSLAVLTDGTKYYVMPAYYILSDSGRFSASASKVNSAIGETKFSSIKATLVRIQLPSGLTEITQSENLRATHF